MAAKWKIVIAAACVSLLALALFGSYALGTRNERVRSDIELANARAVYTDELAGLQRDLDRLDAGVERVRLDMGTARAEAGRITDWYKRVTFLLNEYAKAAGLVDRLAGGGDIAETEGGEKP